MGPSRVAKEQHSKEFDAAKRMLKKFGLLKDVVSPQQPKGLGTRGRLANRTTPPVKKGPVGGGISKVGKGK